MKRWIVWLVACVLALGLAGTAAYTLTPWPKALLIRHAFEKGGAQAAAAMARHVPPGIHEMHDLSYRSGDDDARLDVFRPQKATASGETLPTIVWIHGGAWISGSKSDVAPYLRILASHGYTTVGIDYSIAPGKHYPLPVVQANAALHYLMENAARLGIDRDRLVIAGDSAGGHIAAQLGTITTSPAYARMLGIPPAISATQLRGMVLICGAYDITLPDYNGIQGDFLRTVLWSYSGRRDFLAAPEFRTASVAKYVTRDFPPSFITAGNADPLEPQSKAMAGQLQHVDVDTDTLFYPPDHAPALPHEYQFNLDDADGRQALVRLLAFLQHVTRRAKLDSDLVPRP